MAENDSPAEMSLTLQLPTFWAHRPASWFKHAEAQFAVRRIHSAETKANFVIVSLPENIMEEISDVLDDPSPDLYDRLKSALIKRVELTDQQKVQELFREVELGDRKPSQMLRQMKQLVANFKVDDTFRWTFLLLPTFVHVHNGPAREYFVKLYCNILLV